MGGDFPRDEFGLGDKALIRDVEYPSRQDLPPVRHHAAILQIEERQFGLIVGIRRRAGK